MKKGLRLPTPSTSRMMAFSDRRPDEEGIKTLKRRRLRVPPAFQTADLMKKGLRRRDARPDDAERSFRPQT